MQTAFTKKILKLSIEFDTYLSHNPRLFTKIPNKATLIFTVKGDTDFNKYSKTLGKSVTTRNYKVVEVRKEGVKWRVVSPAALA